MKANTTITNVATTKFRADMKEWNIKSVEALSEQQARELATESVIVKNHTIYLVDFGGYFGYSALVFCNGHHIRYANDYELHHTWRNATHDELKKVYLQKMQNCLFTDEELGEPLKDYNEYDRKAEFLRDLYGMREDYISMFFIGSEAERKKLKEKTSNMFFCPVSFAYYNDVDFANHLVKLQATLDAARDNMKDNLEYWVGAFRSEMDNHEYAINYQADFDTLMAFGNIAYHGDSENELQQYFDELQLNDTQRKAYFIARRDRLKASENW